MIIKVKLELQFDTEEYREQMDEALGSYASEEEREKAGTMYAVDMLQEIVEEAIEADEFAEYVDVTVEK